MMTPMPFPLALTLKILFPLLLSLLSAALNTDLKLFQLVCQSNFPFFLSLLSSSGLKTAGGHIQPGLWSTRLVKVDNYSEFYCDRLFYTSLIPSHLPPLHEG